VPHILKLGMTPVNNLNDSTELLSGKLVDILAKRCFLLKSGNPIIVLSFETLIKSDKPIRHFPGHARVVFVQLLGLLGMSLQRGDLLAVRTTLGSGLGGLLLRGRGGCRRGWSGDRSRRRRNRLARATPLSDRGRSSDWERGSSRR